MKHPLQKSRIPQEKAFVIKELVAPYFDKTWHFHSEFQLFTVLKGRGTRFIGDDMKPFKEGDMVFSGPNLPHLWRNDAAYFEGREDLITHGIVIYFPENFFGKSVLQKEEFEAIGNLLKNSSRGIEIKGETNLIVRKKMQELLSLKGGESLIKLLEILIVIAASSDCTYIAQTDYINQNKHSEHDRMNEVLDFIMKHFQEKITLEEVAGLANMSVSAFSRYFKTRVNKSFSDFLGDVRISNACKLLHDDDMNISQVCFDSGFPTLSNFNKQFKDRMGKTPLAYKKDYLQTF